MRKLQRPAAPRKAENTISLINIVFLMLIFFLVAGQLAPPVDPAVSLPASADADPVAPPDALYIRADGSLLYRGKPVSVDVFLAGRPQEGGDAPVLVAADRALPARQLVEIVDRLYGAGAANVRVVTARQAS
ncbi:ExbD/TolR family protein [Roseibium salinum]|uniref:Biopolymer transporter ExbD n=1 Tax=Roseibium salinum TaxID=1604349 RepID=A0ABT3QWZ2_9HYPH|nr:biopolymer transporter ExbD [Roseibium sp. DSM 29163]MCX2721417.1 biopolymer transporter ExbD [Roseibium sp. DSM 29163]